MLREIDRNEISVSMGASVCFPFSLACIFIFGLFAIRMKIPGILALIIYVYVCVGIMRSINHTMDECVVVYTLALIDFAIEQRMKKQIRWKIGCLFWFLFSRIAVGENGSRKIQQEIISKLMSILLFKSIHIRSACVCILYGFIPFTKSQSNERNWSTKLHFFLFRKVTKTRKLLHLMYMCWYCSTVIGFEWTNERTKIEFVAQRGKAHTQYSQNNVH